MKLRLNSNNGKKEIFMDYQKIEIIYIYISIIFNINIKYIMIYICN